MGLRYPFHTAIVARNTTMCGGGDRQSRSSTRSRATMASVATGPGTTETRNQVPPLRP
jgi:hypothetical protein